jgi:putative addiction module component (TIGR02574 family)
MRVWWVGSVRPSGFIRSLRFPAAEHRIDWIKPQELIMGKPFEELAAQGRALPPEERVRLLDILLDSLDEPGATSLEQAWAQEIERRVRAHERGEGALFDVEEVMAEAEKLAP